ncbi:MAG: hypothetical protein HRT45_04005 [Bdellovibrionales bacterium]|nr:hypothetical protein [Bdellovibrionales bacterium]
MSKVFNVLMLGLFLFTGSIYAEGGAGGFSGGVSRYRKYGDLRNGVGIYFQRDATFINAVNNDTLCLNRADQFQAVPLSGPQRWIYQDRISMKEVCADDRCNTEEWVPYEQKQRQIGEFSHSDRGAFKSIEVVIPNCGW